MLHAHKNEHLVIGGDLNMDFLKMEKCKNTQLLLDLLMKFQLLPCATEVL